MVYRRAPPCSGVHKTKTKKAMKKTVSALAMAFLGYMNVLAWGGFVDRGPTSGWADFSEGEYYDGLACDVFDGLTPGEHWNVRVQNNPDHPGWYRFLPFDGEWPGVDVAGESQLYMIINASNPDHVYMCDTDKILIVNGWQYIFSQIVPENLDEGSPRYGTLRDGVVEFPENSFFSYKCSPADSWDRTQKEVANRTGSLKVVLWKSSGVQQVEAALDDTADAEYFNLQGVKIENPSGGMYIQKSKTGVTKVLIK